ncbi:MAG: hypothetical protein WD030_07780 [Pirellulales bacterium]
MVGGLSALFGATEGLAGIITGSCLGAGVALCLAAGHGWLRPRLAYDGRHLVAYLTAWRPYRIPIELIEVFFIGQTASKLPGRRGSTWDSRSVVVRLSQSARQWHGQPVAARLGEWFGGYIIIRGIWCEPITKDKVEDLNRHLIVAQRQLRDAAESSSQSAGEQVPT